MREGGINQLQMIARRSKKRAAQEREYAKVRNEFLRNNPHCLVRTQFCTYMSTSVHHKKGRIGALLTNTKYFLPTCAECHDHLERNPTWSKSKGYSLSRLSVTN